MTQKEITQQISFASQAVAKWPAWKRNILSHSSKPTNSVARPPVSNEASPVRQGAEFNGK